MKTGKSRRKRTATLIAAWQKDRRERELLGPQQHSLLIRKATLARNAKRYSTNNG